ncbi:MAG: alpha/beta hydrolase [Vicinamibacterales bacterium]
MPLPTRMRDAAVSAREGTQARVFYLHGFASSARSTKAGFLAARLAEHGLPLHCPDFNLPDFATLTMSRMLSQLESAVAALPAGTVTLIGSSLGGTLAVLAADRLPRVTALVLLAPAVMFPTPGHHLLPPERIEAWQAAGSLPFFHYAYGEERPLDFTFYEDSLRYAPMEATVRQPCLIFQGLRDASVDPRGVEAFARQRPHVRLSLLDDDHSLVSSLPRIWEDVRPFLGLA